VERRDFLQTVMTASGAMLLGGNLSCGVPAEAFNRLPRGAPPKKLWALPISDAMSWHEKTYLACLQGLVNRKQTRLYMIHPGTDKFWLEYYQDRFAVQVQVVDEPGDAARLFADELSGYIVYDAKMPHSLNMATTLGALQNALPISQHLEKQIRQIGLAKIDDLCGRWPDLYQAYEWALAEMVPKCNRTLLAQLCVHDPHWPVSTFTNRDYVIANNIFSVDISSSERDKRDTALMRNIYAAYPEGTVVLGWHCVRDKEHEAIGLSSEFGHYGVCTLNTPNLTVHASIRLAAGTVFKQRTVDKKALTVKDKVYVAYQTTDGDAAWFVKDLIQTDWANPQRGRLKYNWGFLPLAYDLMPGMVQYYFENLQAHDYFVAGPSGATYTYPHLHPDKRKFLRLSRYYMEKCGLTTVHMTNWNDRDWWQEVDLPDFHAALRENLPACFGYVRGMGESAFENHYVAGGKPYIFCGEGIHKGSDIYQTMRNFIDACPNRPLFIYNLVNHSVPMDAIATAMARFPQQEIELVHLDELLLLIEKAYEEGRISEELYPVKDGLRQIMSDEAQQAWPGFHAQLIESRRQYDRGETAYVDAIRKQPIGLEAIAAGDLLAFATIWHSMQLVKLTLEGNGIYVNHKPSATEQFLRRFDHLPDVSVVAELQALWDNWQKEHLDFSEAKVLADRLVELAEQLDKQGIDMN
jgi:hypothetical protein